MGLVRVGRNPEELAIEFELIGQTIMNMRRQDDRDGEQRKDGLTTIEWEEWEFWAKAAAWFARETELGTP